MRTITQKLLEEISACTCLDDIKNTVNTKQTALKKNLQSKGIKFDLPDQNIQGGQKMNANEYHDYDEINHIQRGLNISWIHYNEEYTEIENNVKEIINQL